MATADNITPLTELLRACTIDERAELAHAVGTPVNYLYSIAGCHRKRVNVETALAIEDASIALHFGTDGRTPIVTARQLSMMCVIAPFPNNND